MITLYGRTNFYLQGPSADDSNQKKVIFNAVRILKARGYPSAAGLLERYPFKLYEGTNDFNDDFNILYAEVDLEDYEELRRISEDAEGRFAFNSIASTITEIGPYVRVIACELQLEHPELQWRPETRTVEPTGWKRIDRGIFTVKEQLANASSEEEFQTIGLLCREVLISLAQAVYNPAIHGSIDETTPSETDAYRMLAAYIAQEMSGGENEAARRFTKSLLVFANALQHKRTAEYRDAALCVEASTSLVNAIAIISGRRRE